MRCDPTTDEPAAAAEAHALLVDEFAQALDADPRSLVSTPGYPLRDEVQAVVLVEHMLANEDDNHTLAQLLLICSRYAGEGDAQAMAVMQSLSVRFAAEQVARMVEQGAIDA